MCVEQHGVQETLQAEGGGPVMTFKRTIRGQGFNSLYVRWCREQELDPVLYDQAQAPPWVRVGGRAQRIDVPCGVCCDEVVLREGPHEVMADGWTGEKVLRHRGCSLPTPRGGPAPPPL